MFEIVGETSGEVSGAKRFKLPGVTIKFKCPNCGHDFEQELNGHHYLDYPQMNKAFQYGTGCPECEHEWQIPLILKVSLEEADGIPDSS
tara:strand:- start:1653 stop:1919 length:267 start_codon:yes stop_codon:yes gene_type:complete